jgi:hypothetical protein
VTTGLLPLAVGLPAPDTFFFFFFFFFSSASFLALLLSMASSSLLPVFLCHSPWR